MKENILASKSLPTLFLRFVAPSVASMVFVGIQGMVDGLFLGAFVGAEALACATVANPFMQVMLGCAFVLCTGTLSALGRAIGARDLRKSANVFRTSLVSVGVASALLAVLGLALSRTIARILGAEGR